MMHTTHMYLPVDANDLSELSDILLNQSLNATQRARSTCRAEVLEPGSVLIVYRALLAETVDHDTGCEHSLIHIERLVFGSAVSQQKSSLATFILSLSGALDDYSSLTH